ncbi:MAG TPA: rubrerythrin family protein [Spirochaetota bacterium]|nr:rubrerythrin family protein [Spirochaetota bacterium]HPV41836.1 rubrerythrin family protein [Spirochaetota bacterium]
MKNYIIGIICLSMAIAAFGGCKKKDTTIENLKSAITGETTASKKYAAFAQKAKEEKLDKIAKLFEAASNAEAAHAKKHTAVLEKLGEKMGGMDIKVGVKSTKENLEEALKGETYEIDSMYPGFIKTAKEEAKDEAVNSFDWAFQVEKMHQALYKAAIDALAKNDLKNLPDTYAVCPICGNTVAGKAPKTCPICGAPQADFMVIK